MKEIGFVDWELLPPFLLIFQIQMGCRRRNDFTSKTPSRFFSLLTNALAAELLSSSHGKPYLHSHLGREGIFLIFVSHLFSQSSGLKWNLDSSVFLSLIYRLYVFYICRSLLLIFSVPMTIGYILWIFSFNFFEKQITYKRFYIMHLYVQDVCVCIRDRIEVFEWEVGEFGRQNVSLWMDVQISVGGCFHVFTSGACL